MLLETRLEKILDNAGLKKTAGRKAVLEVLLKSEKPLSQQEISEQLPRNINFNYVSIYRSLEAFYQAGIVHRVETGDRVWRFALCECGSKSHCHPHFICKSCGRAECLQEINIPRYSEAGVKDGYIVEEQEYYLRGICRECSPAAGSG